MHLGYGDNALVVSLGGESHFSLEAELAKSLFQRASACRTDINRRRWSVTDTKGAARAWASGHPEASQSEVD